MMIISRFTPPHIGEAGSCSRIFNACPCQLQQGWCKLRYRPVVSPSADSEAPSYYAITVTEGIGFTKDGIAYEYISNGKTRWVLSYQEIAKRLDIDFSKISTIKITRDQILKNGLWLFDVRFDGQQEGTAYVIDVDPENGEIEWVITLEDLPGGNVFTLTMNIEKKK